MLKTKPLWVDVSERIMQLETAPVVFLATHTQVSTKRIIKQHLSDTDTFLVFSNTVLESYSSKLSLKISVIKYHIIVVTNCSVVRNVCCAPCQWKQTSYEAMFCIATGKSYVTCLTMDTLIWRYPWRPRENQINVTPNISITRHQTWASASITVTLWCT